jgi:hypothetical protein
MDLKITDYHRLVSVSDIDVVQELKRLNNEFYNETLDVLALSREINLKRIQRFMNQSLNLTA